MRKIFLLLSAIALVGIASCNKDDSKFNPNYNAETDEVLTQFVLSVSTGQTPQTKMTAQNVQKNNNFLGMQNAKVFAFQGGQGTPIMMVDPNSTATKMFDLGTMFTANYINAANNQTTSSHRILQLSVPTQTNAMLIYGKAINSNDESNAEFDAVAKQRGATTESISSKPSETSFHVVRRIGNDSQIDKYDATGRLMIYVINYILNSSVEGPSTVAVDGFSNLPALTWAELGHKYQYDNNINRDSSSVAAITKLIYDPDDPAYNGNDATNTAATDKWADKWATVSLTPLEETLGNTWNLFTNVGSAMFRAGSSKAIKIMMKNMNAMIAAQSEATATGPEEANAKRLAQTIKQNMQKFFSTSDWAFNGKDIIDDYIPVADWTAGGFDAALDLNGYPYEDFNIPEGAAQLGFLHEKYPDNGPREDLRGKEDVFYYLNPNHALVRPQSSASPVFFDPRKYVFPAELYYYCNSGLRVTDKEVQTSDFPNGVQPWNTGFADGTADVDKVDANNIWKQGKWVTDGSVESHTHGVAVRDNIQYGVALLKTKVAWGAGVSTLKDNRSHFAPTEGNRDIALDKANLKLKGILVGGVNPSYDWQFLPVDKTATNANYGTFDGVIYDDDIVAAAIPTPTDQETYTLVYDNCNWGATQNNVYVTLEFINDGDPFWGKEELIPTGGTFYLIGELKPAATANTGQDGGYTNSDLTNFWPTDYQVPPINLTGDNKGKSKQISRVFIQNYTTSVTFRIGETSLQKAYYSIPDLKQAQMSLGLSVDISWRDGYTYDFEF